MATSAPARPIREETTSASTRDWNRVGLIAVIVALLLLPLVVRNAYSLHILILSLLFAALASSWNLISGYAGIFTFGHQAFFGAGAYTSALLAIHFEISPWWTMPVGGVTAAILGLFIGVPVLRLLIAPIVAIVTLAFAEIVRITTSNWTDLTRGELGLWGIPVLSPIAIPGLPLLEFSPATKAPYYYVAAGLFLAVAVSVRLIVRSRIGLALKAIRDSNEAAASLGVHLTYYKLLVFTISSFMAGVIGAFYAHYVLILTPSAIMTVETMILIIAITLVGGLGTLFGPLLGALLLVVGLEYLRFLGDYRLLIYGALLVLIMLFVPSGIASLWLYLRRWTVAKAGGHPPPSQPDQEPPPPKQATSCVGM